MAELTYRDEMLRYGVPPYPTKPTHEIKVKSRLTLRDNPSWVKVDEAEDKDEKNKGRRLKMLDNGTKVTVIDEATGYDCEWMEVIVDGFEDQRTFIYSGRDESGKPKFVKKLSGTPESAKFECDVYAIPGALVIDWTKKQVGESWFDPKIACHCVSVETEYTSPGEGDEITQRMSGAIDKGLVHILSNNGKKGGHEEKDQPFRKELQDSFIFARAIDHDWSPRPDSKLKILVELPHKYLAAIEDEDSDVEDEDVLPSALGLKYTMKFVTSTMRKEVEAVSSILREHGKSIDKYDGSVENWNGEDEAKSLDKFMQSTIKLFKANDIEVNERANNLFEVGMDGAFVPQYVQVSRLAGDSTTKIFNKQSIKKYGDEEPFCNPRSAGFLWGRHEIIKNRTMPWTDFIITYTLPKPHETPKIIPGQPKKDNDADTSKVPEAGKKKKDEMDAQPFKSESQKSAEDKQLTDEDLRTSIAKERENNSDNVGDSLLQNLDAALGCVQDAPSDLKLEAAFLCILNKIPVQELIMQALACLIPDLPDLEATIGEFRRDAAEKGAFLEREGGQFLEVGEDIWDAGTDIVDFFMELPSVISMSFPDELPIADILGSMVDAIKAALLDILIQAFVSMIVGILEGLVIDCEDDNDFGAQDINDVLNNARNSDGSATTRPQMDNRLKDLGDAFGLNFPDAETIRNILADISSILTPMELCLLLSGSPRQNIIMLVKSLLNSRYPISNRGWTNTNLVKLFKALGRMIDPMYCEQILNPGDELIGFTDSLCDDLNLVEEVRRSLYKEKGMPDAQIDEALKKIKDRKNAKAVALVKALTDPNDNAGIPLIGPDLFCSPSKPGIFKTEHPSVTWMKDTLVDTMMHGPYIAFADDARNFPESLITDEMVTEEVKTTIVPLDDDGDTVLTGDGGHMVNPALGAMGFINVSVGAAQKMGEERRDPEDPPANRDKKYGWINTRQKNKSVATHIRIALEEIETNEVFSMSKWNRPIIPGPPAMMIKYEASTDWTSLHGRVNMQFGLVSCPSDSNGNKSCGAITWRPTQIVEVVNNLFMVEIELSEADLEMSHLHVKVRWMVTEGVELEGEWMVLPVQAVTPVRVPRHGYGDFFSNAWMYEFMLPKNPLINSTLNMFEESGSPGLFDQLVEGSLVDLFTGETVEPETVVRAANTVNPNWKIFYALPITSTPVSFDVIEVIEGMIMQTLDEARIASELHPDSCADFDCDAELEKISEQISQPKSDGGFGLAQNTFSLSCESPHFHPKYYDPTMDDEYVLSVVKNPNSSTPQTVITIYGNEAIAEDIKAMIEEIQSAVGTNIKNVMDVSPPQQMLADLIKYKWSVKAPLNKNSVGVGRALSELTSYYKIEMFEHLSVDIIKYLAHKIAASPYFKTINHEVNIAGQIKTSQTPFIKMLNLAPRPTKQQHDCGMDPHLLRCGEAKQNIMDEMQRQGGSCPGIGPSSLDGLGDDGGPLQDAICQSAIRLLVRAYVIDYLLRGIFPLSAFAPSEETDNALVEYFVALIRIDLKEYGSDIASQVEDTADNLYMAIHDHPPVYHPKPGEKLDKGLKWLVQEECPSVAKELAAMIGTALSVGVHETFLKKLPQFEVGIPVTHFTAPTIGINSKERLLLLGSRFGKSQRFGNEESFAMPDSFDAKNGEVFIERYWRVWAKTKDGISDILNSPDITEVGKEYSTAPAIQNLLVEHMKKWGWKDALTSSGSLQTEEQMGFGNSRGEQCDTGTAGSGVISSEELDALMKAMSSNIDTTIKLSDLFDDVKYGHRIMHLAPPTAFMGSTVDIASHGWKILGASANTLDDVRGDSSFGSLSKKIDNRFFSLERSYEIFEFEHRGLWQQARPLYTTPLCSYEDNVDLYTGTTRSGTTPAMEVTADNPLWQTGSTYTMMNLYDAMASTPEYRLVFDYIFPLDRFVTLLTIYTIQGISSIQNVDMAFDNTHDEILKLFKLCHNIGDYTYIDPNVLCVGAGPGIKETVTEFGKSEFANCLPGINLPDICFKMKGIGISFPIKFAIKTPLIILKALIELLDPCIGLAKLMHMSLKLLGVCLPIPALGWMMLPINIFMPPPIGIGIGPPLTMLGIVYMALGFGMLDLTFMEDGMMGLEMDLPDVELKLAEDTKVCKPNSYKLEAGWKARDSSRNPMPKSSTEMTMAQLIDLYTDEDEFVKKYNKPEE